MDVIQNYYVKNNGRTNSSNYLDRQTRAKELPKFQQIEYDYFNLTRIDKLIFPYENMIF